MEGKVSPSMEASTGSGYVIILGLGLPRVCHLPFKKCGSHGPGSLFTLEPAWVSPETTAAGKNPVASEV